MRKKERQGVARHKRARRRNLLLSTIPALSIAAACGAADAATVISSMHVSATVVATCDIASAAPVPARGGRVCMQAAAEPSIAPPKPVVTYAHDDAAGVTWETIAF
jgi:hypothetical protein